MNAKEMIYNSQNLPRMLSKLLQAQVCMLATLWTRLWRHRLRVQIRNVAGMLDVDQIIEDNSAMDRVSQQMASVAKRWGVHIEFVRIQKVEAGELTHVLAKKKDADLRNKEVIISAKAQKQTRVIESEGHRDRMIREAEGEAQQILSRGTPRGVCRHCWSLALTITLWCHRQLVVKRRQSSMPPTRKRRPLFRCVLLEVTVAVLACVGN